MEVVLWVSGYHAEAFAMWIEHNVDEAYERAAKTQLVSTCNIEYVEVYTIGKVSGVVIGNIGNTI